jgi:hypothetical protein
MRFLFRSFAPLALAAALASPLLITGCAVHARVYDPYYGDYHVWAGETVYYNNWEHDNHRDHTDFNKLSDSDKHAYWDWRHSPNAHQ